MSCMSRLKNVVANQIPIALISLVAVLFLVVNETPAQCVDHPDKKTALKFNNESKFDLTFLIDDDEEGVLLPSKTVSEEINVEPGEHLLRATAIVGGERFWVWVVNEVPQGQICTWTVGDPPLEGPGAIEGQSKTQFRGNSIKSKRAKTIN